MTRKLPAKLMAILLLVILLFSLLALPAAAADSRAAEVLTLVNAERAKQGLPALAGNNQALNNAAQKRAQEIVTKFDHERPNGDKFSTVLDEYGVSWTGCGENIAYGYSTAADVMQAWMESSGHRKNILAAFTEIGIGVFEKDGVCYWTQLFVVDTDGGSDGGNNGSNNSGGAWKNIAAFFQMCWDFFVKSMRTLFGW